MESTKAIESAFELVKSQMSKNDCSHDIHHVQRVRRLALKIASSESKEHGVSIDLVVVEMAALFHDLFDAKYTVLANLKASDEDRNTLEAFFDEHRQSISHERRALILRIIDNVSYSKEKKRIANGLETSWHQSCIELHCVQDADKLDAMGAIGIARCSAYSVVINRPLVPIDTQPNENGQVSSIAHFHDKLLKLRGLLKTKEGQRLGGKRHQFMLDYLDEVQEELNDLS